MFIIIGMIISLNRHWDTFPALGKFLDPYQGCWQNTNDETLHAVTYSMNELEQPVKVRFDERLVPHIFAKNQHDAIFIQGYIHAKFRLWQMDMTTRLASGRLSEVVGEKTLKTDREMRRKGMVFGAQNSLAAMEQDSLTKPVLDAYRDGVNAFIKTLHYSTLPLEYKLMGFEPESWTNLKTSLMIKFMADKLSGQTEDFEMSLAKQLLGDQFNNLYPEHLDEEYPVIGETGVSDRGPQTTDHRLSNNYESDVDLKLSSSLNEGSTNHGQPSTVSSPDAIGSNNWAISGSHTSSGKPILCNDPHLPLNLPAIWYENQLITPDMNVYGVSLPGAPQVVIGFNDSIAWGFTNGYRDVKDFYQMTFKDASKKEYLFDGKYETSDLKIETLHIRNKPDFYDTVAYTKMGIVMYDASFPRKGFEQNYYAVQWMGYRSSNELKALMNLNKSQNYNDFVYAISDFQCPHQNFVFACANGDIAMWSQGLFINKKNQQGRFIEDGTTSDNQWGDTIPTRLNPHELNPMRGFVMSANEINTNQQYPYYYNGDFHEERAKRITKLLSIDKKFTAEDMMKMQNDNYWQNASEILPRLLQYTDLLKLSKPNQDLLDSLKNWNYVADAKSKTAIMYDLWFKNLVHDMYDDEFGDKIELVNYPKERVTLQLLINPTPSEIFDDIRTTKKETIAEIILSSFKKMCDEYARMRNQFWYQYKHTTAEHLSKIPAFSVPDIPIGGGAGIINAASSKSGPSWRMIVHFTNPIEAYGIYPGGQSGNIAGPYYTSMLNDWTTGVYYKLHMAHTPNDIQ